MECSIINYSHQSVVHYIPMTYLFYHQAMPSLVNDYSTSEMGVKVRYWVLVETFKHAIQSNHLIRVVLLKVGVFLLNHKAGMASSIYILAQEG